MDLKKAKDLVYGYLASNLEEDVSILGKDHPYNDSTIGEIQKAFNILKYNYNFFEGN